MSNFIRVLRNKALYSTYELAKTNLEAQLAKLQDGEICIASYGASMSEAKTILGIARYDGSAHSYTIFDNQANSNEIAAEIAKLDAEPEGTSADGKVKVKVVEADGKLTSVTVTTDDIASAALLGTKDDEAGTNTAFARIAKEAADRATAITNAIAALDSSVAATAKDGEQYSVLTGVTQVDGKLTEVAEVKLAAVAKTGLASDVATTAIAGDTTHVAVAGTNVSAQISSIAETLKGISTAQSNAFKYITVKLTPEEVAGLSDASNVKEAYKVVAYIGDDYNKATVKNQVGDTIKIYKDASIHEIYLGDAHDSITEGGDYSKNEGEIPEADLSLNYVYISDEGKYAMVHIPVGNFLRESEFGDGLQVNNGIVSVKKAEGSESFLTVDGNGVKISGVQAAINNAIAGLDATVESTGDSHVTVNLTEVDGKVTAVNVTTTGLALDNAVVKNVTVNNVEATVSGNKATVTIDGTDIAVADTYTATVYSDPFEAKVGTANHIAADDTIAEAFKKAENTISVLADEVISNEKVTTAAVSELAKSVGVVGEGGVIEYVPDTSTTYISTATSVHDATVKLDAAIKNLGGEALAEVVGGNGIEVSTKAANSQTVSLKLDGAADNALAVNANGLYLSNVWDCGTY